MKMKASPEYLKQRYSSYAACASNISCTVTKGIQPPHRKGTEYRDAITVEGMNRVSITTLQKPGVTAHTPSSQYTALCQGSGSTTSHTESPATSLRLRITATKDPERVTRIVVVVLFIRKVELIQPRAGA